MVKRDYDNREPGLMRLGVGYLAFYALAFGLVSWWLA